MDIYSYIKRDHHTVDALMESLLANKSRSERKALFEKIKTELMLHAESEEQTFYKAIEHASRSKQVHEKMEHADKEHDEIREYLEKLETLDIGSEEWMEQFGEFKHSVKHHVEEEEKEMFPEVRKAEVDLKALGEQLAERKKALMAEYKASGTPTPELSTMEEVQV